MNRTLRRLLLLLAFLGMCEVFLAGCWIWLPPSPRQVARAVIRHRPPTPRLEIRKPRRPSVRHVWVSGYWYHSGGRWHWRSGYWNLPPRGKRTWHKGHWQRVSGGYRWVPGYWR